MTDVDFLEAERKKIWSRLTDLEEQIKKKTSDYEQEARQASKRCSEFKNKCESTKLETENLYKTIKESSDAISSSGINTKINEINSFYVELEPKKENVESQINELEALFTNYGTYSDKLTKLDSISETAEENATKAESILEQLTTRKKEVDRVYFEVFGYSTKDPSTGVETKVNGKKDELDKAYSTLKKEFDSFSSQAKTNFDSKVKEWEKAYSETHSKIQSLLPNALTAGLSAANEEKVRIEKIERGENQETFFKAIIAMIAISVIPFGVFSYILLKLQLPFLQAINLMPNITFSVALIYIPALWVAVSASRKINLSKRLIEEYTHKEVVSKTYEGLSKQIEAIKDKETNAELKAILLRNILLVNVENPGKLISDYNQSDHPILEKLGLGKAFSFLSREKSDATTKTDLT